MNTQKFRNIISNIVSRDGLDILLNEGRTLSLFDSAAPGSEKEREALRALYNTGAMKVMVDAKKANLDMEKASRYAISVLRSCQYIDNDSSEAIIFALRDALGQAQSAPFAQKTLIPDDGKPIQKTRSEAKVIEKPKEQTAPKPTPKPTPKPAPPPIAPQRRKKADRSSGWIAFLCIAVPSALIILTALFWQWVIGILLAVGLVVFTIVFYEKEYEYVPQLWVSGILSLVNLILACIWPDIFSPISFLLSIGLAVSLFATTIYAYEDSEEGIGMLSAILLACNITIATTVLGGFSSIFFWLCLFLAPTLVIALIITGINNACDWENGAGVASVVSAVLVGVHILLAFACPHYLHFFNQYPEIVDEEYGPKQAICACGEELELGHYTAEIIHAYSCEDWKKLSFEEEYNYLKNNPSGDETFHWAECKCGMVVSYGVHAYDADGKCKGCGLE